MGGSEMGLLYKFDGTGADCPRSEGGKRILRDNSRAAGDDNGSNDEPEETRRPRGSRRSADLVPYGR